MNRTPTAREIEVLGVYAATGSTELTAARLGITPATVRNTLSNVRAKLGAANTANAVYLVRDRLP